jgi:hypothetical protein
VCINDDDNHSRLDNQHNCWVRKGGGDLYDHLMSTRVFVLVMNKGSHMMSSEIMRNVATVLFWIF